MTPSDLIWDDNNCSHIFTISEAPTNGSKRILARVLRVTWWTDWMQ